MKIPRTGLCSVALSASLTLGAQCRVDRGNILCLDQNRREVTITEQGVDDSPHLSADGSKVVFVRRMPRADCTSIWGGETAGGSPPQPVYSGTFQYEGRTTCTFTSPAISPDGDRVYFLAGFAATSQLLLRYQNDSGKTYALTTALRYWVLSAGKYRGHLVVQQRRVTLSGSYYHYYWLYTPQGQQVDLVARNEPELNEFFDGLSLSR